MRDVGIGMLGCGFIGEFHTLGLRYVPGARVVAHADASLDRRSAYAERFESRPHESIEALSYQLIPQTVLLVLLVGVVDLARPGTVNASILGGRGGYAGTIVGALILTVLAGFLSIILPESWRQIVFGSIIVVVAAACTRLTAAS